MTAADLLERCAASERAKTAWQDAETVRHAAFGAMLAALTDCDVAGYAVARARFAAADAAERAAWAAYGTAVDLIRPEATP